MASDVFPDLIVVPHLFEVLLFLLMTDIVVDVCLIFSDMMLPGWLLWPDGLLHKVAPQQYPRQGCWSWGVLQVTNSSHQSEDDPQNCRLHGHIADLVVPSKTKMVELLHMCSYPRRSLLPVSLVIVIATFIAVIKIISLLIMIITITWQGRKSRSPTSAAPGWRGSGQ